MSDEKANDIKGIADAYEILIKNGHVSREFVLDLLSGKIDWDKRLKDRHSKQTGDVHDSENGTR